MFGFFELQIRLYNRAFCKLRLGKCQTTLKWAKIHYPINWSHQIALKSQGQVAKRRYIPIV